MNLKLRVAQKPIERRRHHRAKVTVLGRYMLADKREYPCQTLDMSVGGVSLFAPVRGDRKSTRLNSSHANISYAVFCLKKKNQNRVNRPLLLRRHARLIICIGGSLEIHVAYARSWVGKRQDLSRPITTEPVLTIDPTER